MMMDQELDDSMEVPADNTRFKRVCMFGLATFALAGIAGCGFMANAAAPSQPPQFLTKYSPDEAKADLPEVLKECTDALPLELAKAKYTQGEQGIIKTLWRSCEYLRDNLAVIGEGDIGEGEDMPQEVEAVSNILYAHDNLGEHILGVKHPVRTVSKRLGWLYGLEFKGAVRKEAKGVRGMLVELLKTNNAKNPPHEEEATCECHTCGKPDEVCTDCQTCGPSRRDCKKDFGTAYDGCYFTGKPNHKFNGETTNTCACA